MRKTSKKFERKTAKGDWACSICSDVFRTRDLLNAHRKDKHPPVENKRANHFCECGCQFCGKKLTTKEGKTIHERSCQQNPNRIKGSSHKLSEETKKKLSESMKKVYEGKSIWRTQIEKRKSYAEQYFSTIFEDAETNFHVSRFFLDFAWPEKKVYIEVDGEQHYTPEGIERDRERTEILKNEGWNLIERIRWSQYVKLTFEEKQNVIKRIRSQVNL